LARALLIRPYMLRTIVLAVATSVLGLTTFVGQAQANTAAHCAVMLEDVETARTSLEGYDASIVSLDAERQTLVSELAVLDAKLVGATGKAMLGLRAQRDALAVELTLVDGLRPDIVAQRDALQAAIDQSERGYIVCVESSIE